MVICVQTLSKTSNGAAEVTRVKESGQAYLLGVMVGDQLIGKYVLNELLHCTYTM